MKSYDDSNWCQMFARWFKMVTIVATVLVGFATPVSAQFGNGTFELEGDISDSNPTDMIDDWEGPPTHAFSTTDGLLHEESKQTIFTGGGSKDIRDVTQWKWTHGSVPDKDDIQNAYAAAYNVENKLHVFLAGDRYSTDGSAQMGVWFFQEKVGLNSETGTFIGKHTEGDILMLAEFTEGGRAANVKVYVWDTEEKINLRLLFEGQGDDNYFATSNGEATRSWELDQFTPKGGSAGDYFPPNSFFEGGMNLSKVFELAGVSGELPCFSSFLMETRSSHRANAQLKDFILGDLNTCKLEIANMCRSSVVDGSYASLTHTFDYNISNSGFGVISDIVLTHSTTTDATGLGNVGSVTAGNNLLGEYSYTNMDNPAEDTLTATYKTGFNTSASVVADAAKCAPVVQSLNISIFKTCTQELVIGDSSGHVEVRVGYDIMVCNEQNGTLLTNVMLTDETAGVSTSLGDLYPPDGYDEVNKQCRTYMGTYFPTTATYNQTNTAEVIAYGALNEDVNASASWMASCNLCPEQTPE